MTLVSIYFFIASGDLIKLFQNCSDNWLMIKILKILSVVELSRKHLKAIEQRIIAIYEGFYCSSVFDLPISVQLIFYIPGCHKNSILMEKCAKNLCKFLNHQDINCRNIT
ncbi:hypothetical protein MXB_2040 [Myxobolus squamalis]|nr:hypothetical protein MXB_2040 [Myxobolus squamalis]